MPLSTEPAWQDMAFLAAIPAATVVNNGAPSLIAFDPVEPLWPEIQDYLRRYRPDAVFLLGNNPDDHAIPGAHLQCAQGRLCGRIRMRAEQEVLAYLCDGRDLSL